MARSRIALVAAAVAVVAAAPFIAAGVAGMIQHSSTPVVLATEDTASSGQHDGHIAPGPTGSDDPSITSPMPQETDSPVDVAEPVGPGSLLAAADSSGPGATVRDLGEPRGTIDPSAVLSNASSLGGCLVDYGDNGQCVPVVPPSQAAHVAEMVAAGEDAKAMSHPWSCDELIRYFPDGVRVRGVDSQSLDADGDGVACTSADRTPGARTPASPAPADPTPTPTAANRSASPSPRSTPTDTPAPSGAPTGTPSPTPGSTPTEGAPE